MLYVFIKVLIMFNGPVVISSERSDERSLLLAVVEMTSDFSNGKPKVPTNIFKH